MPPAPRSHATPTVGSGAFLIAVAIFFLSGFAALAYQVITCARAMSDGLIADAVGQVRSLGFAVRRGHFHSALVDECRDGLRAHWEAFLRDKPPPNRVPARYFRDAL